jgi:mono/diheme cytochrome c family protein
MPLKHAFAMLCLCISAPRLAAQDGEQLYGLYCSACHGADGKGATGGAFPPLAGSDWITGNPKRSVAIILKGLHGPVEVSGKTYNLEMPPQGAVLPDDQIVAILNHVHTAWGNQGQKITPDLVKATRAEFESRTDPWTAPELLKLYPLELRKTALANLTSRVYKGQWNSLPDFNAIESENVEEEHNGILDTSISGLKDHYGIVWEGGFMAPEDGGYEFALDADDGARVLINGQPVSEVKGIGPMGGNRGSTGKTNLTKGENPIRIEYFQATGLVGISLKWRKAGGGKWNWLTKPSNAGNGGATGIPLAPQDGKTVIYRNFIQGTTPRAIAFGFPGGLNLAYSADNLAPELVWAGDFIDAGRHWTNRGQGNQPPSGDMVIKLTDRRYLGAEARFRGYSLDSMGNPSFKIVIGDQLLTDAWKPGETGTLVRTLTLTGGSAALDIPAGGDTSVVSSQSVNLTPGRSATLIYKPD